MEPGAILLVAYDLESDLHGTMRRFLREAVGEEGDTWIRVQRSVLFVYVTNAVQDFSDALGTYFANDEGWSVYIADVTYSAYAGRGDPEVWAWLNERQKATAAAVDSILRTTGITPRPHLAALEDPE